MKVSLNWVKEYTKVDLSVDELVTKIGAQLGEVESVVDLSPKYQGIVIVRVVSCIKHDGADKLSICKVDDGGKVEDVERDAEGLVQVVCGAPNVHADMLAVWLPPGVTVPATLDKDPLVLETREIRGQKSNGMLASAQELAIGDDHSGIVELDAQSTMVKIVEGEVPPKDVLTSYESEPKVKPGDDLATTYGLDDQIIDIENKMFTHRPDCFGVLGVAREIAGITQQQFTSPAVYKDAKLSSTPLDDDLPLEVKNEIPELVQRFMAQVYRDVHVGPSPFWMKAKLARVGIRSINNVVDITNYFMYLTGQPLHAYDYDKVKAQDPGAVKATIIVRLPKPHEKIELLNGKEITPHKQAIVIASATKPIGLGGVMGGANTEVDTTTTRIILECANFDMYSIRKTSMEHGLFTDAVTRFNKGQSALQCDKILAWVRGELIHISGVVPDGIVDLQHSLKTPPTVTVGGEFITDRLGVNLNITDMAELLKNVEFDVKVSGSELVVTPPFWRTDIEIPEDIVEEVGRLYGYDNLQLVLPQRDLTPAAKNDLLTLKQRIRSIISSAGANEVLTYSFVHGNLLDRVGQDKDQAFQLSNAISPDLQYYRLSLLPSLLDKVYPNLRSDYLRINDDIEFVLYEIGKAHSKTVKDSKELEIPAELERLAMVVTADPKTAQRKYSGATYFQAMVYLDTLLAKLGIPYTVEKCTKVPKGLSEAALVAPFDLKRLGRVTSGQQIIGYIGECNSSVRRNLKLPAFTAGIELDVNALLGLQNSQTSYQELPRYPKVVQDITLKVPSSVDFGDLSAALHEAAKAVSPDRTTFELLPIDIYQKSDDKTGKHLTFRLWMAHYDRTLTAVEVHTFLDGIAQKVKVKLGAERI